ncbi:MAG: hypothetical protein FWB79_02915 [Treponema sp.]|nr:hypothetical protein [Treponema sp.]
MDRVVSTIRDNRTLLVPAIVCAVVCVVMMRLGVFSLFFLVPLGFSAVAYGAAVAWIAFGMAALGYGVLAVALSLGGGTGVGLDLLYFLVLAKGFTWVMAGNPPWVDLAGQAVSGRLPEESLAPAFPRVRTLFRFVVVSVVVAFMFLGTTLWFGRDGFSALAPRIEPLVSAYIASVAGGDAVRQSVLEQALDAERVIGMVVAITLRGGALFSAVFLLFFSRQMAFALARLFRRKAGGAGDLSGFFAPRRTILFFSLSLPAILLGRVLSLQAVEIAAWNLLVMCALVFLAQGGGVVLFNLARRPVPRVLRVLLGALFVIVVFSPGLNFVALGALLVLGIAENWLPMRAARRDSSPT